MKETAIVILNWNGARFLKQFLPALIANTTADGARIIVADNGSGDESVEILEGSFPSVEIIKLEQNYGFAGGYNRALQQVDSDYYVLLNSDVEVPAGWLEPLLVFMEAHPGVAAISPKLLNYNKKDEFEYAGAAGGYIDRYGYAFCRGRIFDHMETDKGQYDDITSVFWASGACFLIRSALYHESGGLDEHFFAHMEEIDLCWRLKRMGYQIAFHPGSHVWHVGGGTLPKSDPVKTYLNFRNNLFLLYKNLPAGKRQIILILRTLLDMVSALRFLIRPALPDFKAVIKAHVSFQKEKKRYRNGYPGSDIPKKINFAEIYPSSIVLDFFLLGRSVFSELRKGFPKRNREIKE